jgi:hypothetical protein
MNTLTEFLSLAAYGVLCLMLGVAVAATVQAAIERRRSHHEHAPDPPWPARPLTNDDPDAVQSHR